MFAPRGIRNMNYGNIEDGPFAQGLPGYAGTDGRFARFDSPANGMNAMETLLGGYGRRGINSITGVINRWAPASDNNNVSAYAAHVAKSSGLDPNGPIDLSDPQVRQKMARAMAEHENGPAAFNAAFPAPDAGPSIDQTTYGAAPPRAPGNFGATKTIFPGKREAAPTSPEGFMAGGPGAWFGMPNGVTSGGYDVGGALQGAGAGLASISSPQQGAALAQLARANDDQWHMTVNPATGAIVRINRKTGKVEAVTGAMPQRSKSDDAYDTKLGGELVEQRSKIIGEASGARSKNAQLDQLGAALGNPNVYQGFGGESVLTLKKAAQTIGFNVDGIPDSELANKISKQLALELRNPTGGAGMPGALSDSDRKYLTQMVAGLDNSPEGNRRIIELYKSLNQRSIDIDGLRSKYEDANSGRLNAGFAKHVSDWAAANPLFKQEPVTNPAQRTAPTNRPPLDSIFR